MVQADLDPYIQRYKQLMWEEPKPNVERTCDQVSVLKHILTSGHTPYVDFAVWGPFNDRFQKSQQFIGLTMGSDGNLHKVEVRGPSILVEWCEAFNVFACAMIMLWALMPTTNFGYRDWIMLKV